MNIGKTFLSGHPSQFPIIQDQVIIFFIDQKLPVVFKGTVNRWTTKRASSALHVGTNVLHVGINVLRVRITGLVEVTCN